MGRRNISNLTIRRSALPTNVCCRCMLPPRFGRCSTCLKGCGNKDERFAVVTYACVSSLTDKYTFIVIRVSSHQEFYIATTARIKSSLRSSDFSRLPHEFKNNSVTDF